MTMEKEYQQEKDINGAGPHVFVRFASR
jgi:hypothetical protein